MFQFVYEGMEESGSEGLDDLLFARKDTFLKVSIQSFYGFTNKIRILESV